ncbi:unnamed protein product [Hymenolepis diminuta]|uniref:Uncharacterized protein n=1 Tax=Hymenolepis diminuta TaxID=6216 RepID=A0A564Z0E7_HYMDI|nr:unnamed protein product [Hymenolepis diminuta]
MIEAEIVPELALRSITWELFLGMPIHQVIEIFKRLEGTISSVDLWYSEKSPFDYDILLHLPNDGLKLHFEPMWQRLKLIEITDLTKISLTYLSHQVNASNKPPNLSNIINVFGSTKQLLTDEESGLYRLCYRGLTFLVAPSSPVDVMGAAGLSSTSTVGTLVDTGLSSTSVDEEALVVRRVFIFPGPSKEEYKLPPELPASCYHGNVFLERLNVVHANDRTVKLCFDLVCQDLSSNSLTDPKVHRFSSALTFGDTAQDVLSALGSPSRVFYKTEDKMSIHLPQTYRQSRQSRCDYFYNYFTLGLDVLFDSRTHRAISFIMHTNQPGEYTFNTYFRCMFEIPLTIEAADGEAKVVTITPFVKVQSLLNGVLNESVVIHRETPSRKNPFGSTNAYNYRDLIFEVLPQNGSLASVTIYSLPDNA